MRKGYIFDFDGTLADTFLDSLIAFNKSLIEYDVDTFHINDLENVSYVDFRNFAHRLEDNADNLPIKDIQLAYRRNSLESKRYHTELYPGIRDVLKTLKDNGVSISICSNRDQILLDSLVDYLLGDIAFDCVVGYRKGLPGKPDPYKLNRIIEKSNLDKDNVLYVGDRSADILTAENANVDMAFVTWGQKDDISMHCNYPLKMIDNAYDLLDL